MIPDVTSGDGKIQRSIGGDDAKLETAANDESKKYETVYKQDGGIQLSDNKVLDNGREDGGESPVWISVYDNKGFRKSPISKDRSQVSYDFDEATV